jgi:dissimilatory sulfite reductase (desulfoviridin) alpha/beta subunit
VCTRTCPFGAYSSQGDALYRIFIGGTWGKKTRMGTALSRLVTHEEIFPLLEKTMLWFKENAYQKERLGAAIDRIGVDKLEEALFADDLLERKEAILAAPILQRG